MPCLLAAPSVLEKWEGITSYGLYSKIIVETTSTDKLTQVYPNNESVSKFQFLNDERIVSERKQLTLAAR
jgi:hypothetical protein